MISKKFIKTHPILTVYKNQSINQSIKEIING
jgi:hypothetical protein